MPEKEPKIYLRLQNEPWSYGGETKGKHSAPKGDSQTHCPPSHPICHASLTFQGGISLWMRTAPSVLLHPMSWVMGTWAVLGTSKPKDEALLSRSSWSKAAILSSQKCAYRPNFWIFQTSGQFIIVLTHFLKYTQFHTPYSAEQALSLSKPAIHRTWQKPAFHSISPHIWTQLELEHPGVEALPC